MSSVAPIGTPAAALPDDAQGTPALVSVGERLRDERDWAIRGAHGHGVPIPAIARMMKMSIQRVSQIVGA
jgi:hypothetical protein